MIEIDVWGIVVKPARERPQQSVVKILFPRRLQRYILKSNRFYFVEPLRKLVPRDLTLFGADPQVKSAVSRTIWPVLAVDVERDYAFAAVKSDRVDHRHDRRHDLFAAYTGDLGLHPFGVAYALDTQLVIDAKYDRSAVRIGERDYSLRDAFRVRKLDL